ncbi:hypothetical protein K504DRAFT_456865 [Pleomassaria siparia CBS 279.74]|uniref:Uncharacterized protein n=1 Tax=Pleomassaria siparia CBS 279.74 TaxID=1314801 RepID=A0A6G1KPX6_9PLEO|nr:hypothetical protein K504DRAFT_456865 [Pleomassaria siparia CBS 279.74]
MAHQVLPMRGGFGVILPYQPPPPEEHQTWEFYENIVHKKIMAGRVEQALKSPEELI